MKKLGLILTVLFVMVSVSFALTINDVVNKDVYTADGVQATLVRKIDSQGKNLTIEGKYYMKDNKTRADMTVTADMVKNQAQLQQLKMIGMDERINISVDKDKSMTQYTLFPKNKAYIKRSRAKKENKSYNLDEMMNKKIEKIGSEKFNNMNVVKYKVLEPEKNVKNNFIFVKDNLIVGSEVTYTDKSKTNKMEIYYKDLKKGVKDNVFNIPKNYKKYSSPQAMMQDVMQKGRK